MELANLVRCKKRTIGNALKTLYRRNKLCPGNFLTLAVWKFQQCFGNQAMSYCILVILSATNAIKHAIFLAVEGRLGSRGGDRIHRRVWEKPRKGAAGSGGGRDEKRLKPKDLHRSDSGVDKALPGHDTYGLRLHRQRLQAGLAGKMAPGRVEKVEWGRSSKCGGLEAAFHSGANA